MSESAPVDLRSDTVTKPGARMRQAMAQAEVGDDVYGEDPTTLRLEQRTAEILAREAALFVPSGSMANQIAIKLHTQPGDEVLIGSGGHSLGHEAGGAGLISGVQIGEIPGDGRFDAAALRAQARTGNHHGPPTRLVIVENTQNMGGGLVWDSSELAAVLGASRELGLRTHLDGARLWNAAAASGTSEAELARGFDTISVCLSKGLGAPIGSLLVGSAGDIARARHVRKMLGGGMRQVGVLAAAGAYALEHGRGRLQVDHENARHLARELAGAAGLSVDEQAVATNIVMIDVAESIGTAEELRLRAADRGLLFWPTAPQRIRLVTHLDVDRAACDRAASILRDLCA